MAWGKCTCNSALNNHLRALRREKIGIPRASEKSMIGIVCSPVVLGHRSSAFLEELSLPGDRPLLIPATDAAVDFVTFCFGLYEQRLA
jgi:hypothetical protein